jgi:hypothetical protein
MQSSWDGTLKTYNKKLKVVIKRFYFIVSVLERFRVGAVIWVERCTVVQKRV